MAEPALAVHGGAFSRPPSTDPAFRARWRGGIAAAVASGRAVLADGGSALDAVVAAVEAMEAGGVFNAGRAAVPADDGERWLDSAVMDGPGQAAGAVAAVRGLRHPVHAARAVLRDGRHVLLAGEAAARFALAAGCAPAPPGWFHDVTAVTGSDTVGAVARDAAGRLAAATSTGGLRGKRAGRVGDAPLPGSGTWADGRVAVSCTGAGEFFIRAAVASRIAFQVEAGTGPLDAARAALARMAALGGDGGCIVLDAAGPPVMALAVPAMSRGSWTPSAGAVAAIGGDEALTPV